MIRVPVASSRLAMYAVIGAGLTLPLGAQVRPAAELPVIPAVASARPFEGAWPIPEGLPVEVAYQDDRTLSGYGVRVRMVPADSVNGLESYTLTVAPGAVTITAPRMGGRFYALLTLQQLVDAARAANATAPQIGSVTITDAPRFAYRGMHLDVARHFQPVEFVKRYIDLMARYKLNTFHWHLTDDQGWRLEIKQYPRLTEIGSCRDETMLERNFEPYRGDGIRHCGFYTQDEVRDVVAYAAARNITVVPEIEMPGHAVAALTAYPELGCTPGPFQVMRIWGVSDDIFCPSERTFAFLQDVLTEVLAIFPSTMIHIGGDEAPKVRWKASPLAQEIIQRERLKDEHELQSWFIRRIDAWLTARGRRLVGWDEILEGGLAPGATVMSWRGIGGGIEAAKLGRDVIMTPTSHLYFDYYQGDARFEPLAIGGLVTLEQVYGYEPIPDVLTPAQATHILGAQGNIWTEYLKTPAQVEFMAFPRAIALAEVTWSPKGARSWASFERRLPQALTSLDRLNVNYRLPHVSGLDRDVLTLEPKARVTLGASFAGAEIRYTTDGTDPTARSPLYSRPFEITTTFDGVKVTARAFTADGRSSPPRVAVYRRTNYREADGVQAAALALGLQRAYYETTARTTVGLDTLTPARRGIADEVERTGNERAEGYALIFTGYLEVPANEMYEFGLSSDDGSTLHIGETLVVDNDGLHGSQERTGMIALRTGAHPLTLRYFQAGGGADLRLRMRVGNGPWRDIPRSWLFHKP
ncbi:MAG: family 20 glycosylhydrolase [Gemmatimonadetes bacterium]|nr:family 20 glycosylhydrolase [Gemmatimonadota bacterium]